MNVFSSYIRVLKKAVAGLGFSRSPEFSATHAWERWEWVYVVLFYLSMILPTVGVLAGEAPTRVQIMAVSLVLLLGSIFVLFSTGHLKWDSLPQKLSYVSGATLIAFVLMGISELYFLLFIVLIGQLYILFPPRQAIPAAVALTALLTLRFFLNAPEADVLPNVLQGLFWAIVGPLWALQFYAIIHQSAERQHLIEELESTRAELAKEERRAGVLEERGRLAREIHDTLAQGFISIVTHLEAAEDALSLDEKAGHKHLDQARTTARESLVEARRLVRALRPELLESSSLPEALERLAERWSESSGVPSTVSVAGDEQQLPQELQVTLFRVAQEALTNIRKHAGAHRVDLTLSFVEDLVLLDVQDDGAGFDPDIVPNGSGGGFGLRAMRERIEPVGGNLLVESAPGEGTTLAVELPVEVPGSVTAAEGENS